MLSANSVAYGENGMTRAKLVQLLRYTAIDMQNTAAYLEFFGGSSEAVKHASELRGAAQVVAQWADELNKDES